MKLSRSARLGLVALCAAVVAFAIFYFVQANGPRRGAYRFGVHFATVSGLAQGAQVFMNGVEIGSVSKLRILPDNSVEVIVAIPRNVDIPKASIFSIRPALTGGPTLGITTPPQSMKQGVRPTPLPPSAILEKRVMPIAQQPVGSPPLDLEAFVHQSVGLQRRVTVILGRMQSAKPAFLAAMQHRNDLAEISVSLKGSFVSVLGALQSTMTQARAEVAESKTRLYRRDEGKLAVLSSSLAGTARAMNVSMDSLHAALKNPQAKSNLRQTMQNVQTTMQQLRRAANDLQTVTANPQTRAELRDASANLQAAIEKAFSLL